MYCKLYIQCKPIDKIISILESYFGNSSNVRNDYRFNEFESHIIPNKEYSSGKACEFPDGFLYFETIMEIETNQNYIEITNNILNLFWDSNIPAIASCDYENKLHNHGGYNNFDVPWVNSDK